MSYGDLAHRFGNVARHDFMTLNIGEKLVLRSGYSLWRASHIIQGGLRKIILYTKIWLFFQLTFLIFGHKKSESVSGFTKKPRPRYGFRELWM
jgi:hypothetical protein